MATVWAFIRTTTKAKAKVRFRVTGDNGEIVFHTSEITVLPDQWDKKGNVSKQRFCLMQMREPISIRQ